MNAGLNDDDWTGSGQQRRPQENRFPPRVTFRYTIKADTECTIRKQGKAKWREYRTTKLLVFDRCHSKFDAAYVFERDDWYIQVAFEFVAVEKIEA